MTAQAPAGAALCATVDLASDLAEVRRFLEQIEESLKANHFCANDLFGIKISLHEALYNAIRHGNRLDPDKKVHITYCIQPGRFEISITDEGPGFDPAAVPDCRAVENLERPCGRGLLMMRHYMTEVTFNERGNSISMTKCSGQ